MPDTPPPDGDTVLQRRILELVGQLVAELRPGSAAAGINPDDSLERDLGLGSLEQVELLSRIERTTGIRVPDTVLGNADTPADLARAVAAAPPASRRPTAPPGAQPARPDSEPHVAEAGPASRRPTAPPGTQSARPDSAPGDSADSGPQAPETPPAVRPALETAAAAPESAETLVDVLEWHAQASPDRPHIHLREDDGRERTLTYGWLRRRAVEVAAALRGRGIGQRDTVAIMLRTEAAFFPAFFGTLFAGAIPVPVYPPFRPDRIAEYAQRQGRILSNAGARLLITFAAVERLAALLRGQAPTLSAVATLDDLAPENRDEGPGRPPGWREGGRAGAQRGNRDEERPGRPPGWPEGGRADARRGNRDEERPGRPPGWLTGDDPALIQYTSGSTGQPKGVLLTHANLLANIRAIRDGLGIRPDDVAVSWLPLYHDMGLIGAWLGSLYTGVPVVILSPLAFLSRPARWLQAIHAHRATLSVAPNFAFDLCVAKIADDEMAGLDLGSLRVLLNGSEAILPRTLTRFAERFAPVGLRPDALRPVYGLAECSVGLAVTPPRRPPRVDRVAPAFRTTGRAEPSAGPDALEFVSCGAALPGHEMRVVDEHGATLGERREGRVQFRGPSTMAGYYRNPAATRAVAAGDGWLDSGDLGYLAGDEVHLTGRRKDVIIKAGRNIYPHEAEAVVDAVDGVRKGCVAAFGVPDADLGTERLVVVAETRATEPARRDEMRREIVERVAGALGVPPDTVALAPPGAVLKTSSGKVRRGATRDAWRAGRLDRGAGSRARQIAALVWAAARGRGRRAADFLLRAAYTLYMAGLLVVLTPPLWLLVRASRRPRTARRWLSRFARLLAAASLSRVTASGLEHARGLGPAVFVANHASFADSVVVLATLPAGLRFAAKSRLADYPILKTLIRRSGYLRIEKDAAQPRRMEGADAVRAALDAGESMFVFPEGRFVRAPGLLPFRLGAFRAAAEAGRPIVPVALTGTRRLFPAGTVLLRPGCIQIAVAPPLRPRSAEWSEIVRLRDEARRVIAEHAGEESVA